MELRTKTKFPEHQELGAAFRVGSKTLCSIYEEGSLVFEEEVAEITIGIGKSYVAKMYLPIAALEALRKGEEISTFKKLRWPKR